MLSKLFNQNVELLAKTHPGLAGESIKLSRSVAPSKGMLKKMQRRAEVHWNRQPPGRQAIYIQYGMDFGYVLRELCRAEQSAMYAYLVVEPSLQQFVDALHVIDLAPVLARRKVFFVVGVPDYGLSNVIGTILTQGLLYTTTTGALTYSDTESYAANKPYFQKVTEAIKYAVGREINQSRTNAKHATRAIENRMANLVEAIVQPKAHNLRGLFDGKPGVIVSAGPSINKNIHLLHEAKGKAVIVAVNTIYKRLLAEGIVPDVVVTMDTSDAVQAYYKGVPAEVGEQVLQIILPAADPTVLELHPGPRAMVFTPSDFGIYGFDTHGGRVGAPSDYQDQDISMAASCAHMAYSVAAMFGCNPIALIGQDLCYGPDLATHATGITFAEGEGITSRSMLAADKVLNIHVKGNYEPVVTNAIWHGYINQFSYLINSYAGDTYNCTEGGAFIDKAKLTTLREFVDEFVGEPVDVGGAIASHLSLADGSAAKEQISFVVNERIPEAMDLFVGYIAKAEALGHSLESADCVTAVQESLTLAMEMMSSSDLRMYLSTTLQQALVAVMMAHHGIMASIEDWDECVAKLVGIHAFFIAQTRRLLGMALNAYRTLYEREGVECRVSAAAVPESSSAPDAIPYLLRESGVGVQ